MLGIRFLTTLALLAVLAGCGSDSTTGRPVALGTELTLNPALDDAFETRTGWRVRLSAAAVSLAALYYFDGEPAFTQRATPTWKRVLAELVGPSVARAHPGHYQAGSARGQMIEPASLSLSGDVAELPAGTGFTGSFRSGQVVFANGDGGLSELAGAVARVEGRAEKDGKTVHFVLTASYEDIAQNAQGGAVSGCAFDAAEVEGDGTVRLQIQPQVWLDYVHFDDVAEGSADQPTEIPAGDDAQYAFAVGVAQLSAYHFAYRAAQ